MKKYSLREIFGAVGDIYRDAKAGSGSGMISLGIASNDPVQYDPSGGNSSRRRFLRAAIGAGAAAAGVAGTLLSVRSGKKDYHQPKQPDEPELPEPEIITDNRIYKSGDAIPTKVAKVYVDGWKVIFDELDILYSNWLMGDKGLGYRFVFKNPSNTWHGHFQRLCCVYEQESSQHLDKIKFNYMDNSYLYVLPGLGDVMTLEVDIFDSGQGLLMERIFNPEKKAEPRPTKVYAHKFRPDVHAHKSGQDKVRILSERRIPGSSLQPVHDLHRLFSSYREMDPVYIIDGRKKNGEANPAGSQHYNLFDKLTVLFTDDFVRPQFARQAERAACHELAHNLVQNSSLSGSQNAAWSELEKTFGKMREDAARHGGSPIPSVFAVFREAGYEKRLTGSSAQSEAGHPWDNAGELFASALTTLRYSSGNFAKNYGRLAPEDRELVTEAGSNVVNFLRAVNPNEAQLRRLIPDIGNVHRTMNIR